MDQLCAADHDALRVRDLEIPLSPFRIPGHGGPEAFADQIPVQRVHPAHSKDHAIPGPTAARRGPAEVDDTLPPRIVVNGASAPPKDTSNPSLR